MPFADDQIVYRSFADAGDEVWGEFHLFVSGVDVTKWGRDGRPAAFTQLGSYQLTDPYSFGPADFRFPQINLLDRPDFGTGDLAWLAKKADVALWKVKDGALVRPVWMGLIHDWDLTREDVTIHCGGDLSGRAALRYKPTEVVYSTRDAGQHIYMALRSNLGPHAPAADTGIDISEKSLDSGVTFLQHLDSIVNLAQTRNGTQWTICWNGTKYETVQRDRDTVAATFFMDAAGVIPEISESAFDEPTGVYIQGRDPDGGSYCNLKAQNWAQGPIPDFPGDLNFGETSIDVYVARARLRSTGQLDAEVSSVYDEDLVEAVEEIQADAGLTIDGETINAKTWDAMWDIGVTGFNMRNVRVEPVVEKPTVRPFLRNSVGAIIGENPNYAGEQAVDLSLDVGTMRKKDARHVARTKYEQANTGANYVGTLTFETDLSAGDWTHDPESTPIPFSRLDIEPGHNLRARNFGDTKLCVAGVQVSFPDPGQPLQVRCAVDSKGRNFLEVAQIIARNQESRQHPARQWRREKRGRKVNEAIPEWNREYGGKLGQDLPLKGDRWNVVPIFAGQQGTLEAIETHVRNSKCPYYMALFAAKVNRSQVQHIIGNPSTKHAAKRIEVAEARGSRLLLEMWGQPDQRCGYSRGAGRGEQTGDDGKPTGDPVTGDFYESAGIPYFTSTRRDDATENCVLWLAIWPTQDCVLQAGQILRCNFEAGM